MCIRDSADTESAYNRIYLYKTLSQYYYEFMYLLSYATWLKNKFSHNLMMELQTQSCFNNRWIKLNVRWDIILDGHTDEDQSNRGFLNLKNALITVFKIHKYGILTVNSFSTEQYIAYTE